MHAAVTFFVTGKSIANSATLLCAPFSSLAHTASEGNPPHRKNIQTQTRN